MATFSFWQKWLFGVGLLIVAFGLALAVFNQTPAFDFLFNDQINPVFWTDMAIPDQSRMLQQWVYGVLGATVAGWGVFLAFIAHYPYRQRERWAWNCIAAGIGLWYVVDTAICVFFGVWFNAAFNTVLLMAVGLPLIFTRKAFSATN